MPSAEDRTPLLYLAPWVDIGGSDKGTIDLLKFLDRARFRPSLITTQPSANRRLCEAAAYTDELWELPELLHGDEFPRCILAFINSRRVKLVHIMNSRLAFDLLPDISSLPDRPRVVVQLHVEEPDRSGYVRYVTTRYGNLVDAFSVSSKALSNRLGAYDIPIGKRRLIPTGVDAERQFCPDRVKPIAGLDNGRFQILFPARITAQKGPLLMVEVAARLRELGLRFQIHVLGDGDLAPVVNERVEAAGLQHEVILHGSCLDVAPWYCACELVLLTSVFEGLPYTAYEAMAMELPIIAPHLPGFDELVTPDTGVLVSPRDDAQAYADAICALAADAATRRQMGNTARARVLREFSLRRMAAEHQALYGELLASTPGADRSGASSLSRHPRASTSPAFTSRRPGASPLVSVIVPCFNHGRYLRACLRSIARQTYEPIETIVADDGSTEPETLEVLEAIERSSRVRVLRSSTNRGPSAARNTAVEQSRGRYVLPLDADNLLLPNAVAELVEQLSHAGEQVGFVYPNLQYFGNRTDYWQPPSYNLYSLLCANYCDTSSLIDREVFDLGARYPEDIVWGHEDWDFALSLAERGIYGEPARTKTLLYRKRGFTRNELVETSVAFGDVVAARHPKLYDSRVQIKALWNPAVTLIALDPTPGEREEPPIELVSAATAQSCPDFELIIRTSHEFRETELGRRLRRVPSALARSRAQSLAQGLEIARGRYVLAAYGSPAELLVDPALVEKTLRILQANPQVAALAFADAGPAQPPLRVLDTAGAQRASLIALCWTGTGPNAPTASLSISGHRPLETLARWVGAHTTVQWRHLPGHERAPLAPSDGGAETRLGAPRRLRGRDALLHSAPAALPEWPPGLRHLLASTSFWRPPQTRLLCRHRHQLGDHFRYTTEAAPPEGYGLDHVLGSVHEFPLPGTTSLVLQGDRPGFVFGERVDPIDSMLLGFVEQEPLPLLDTLLTGRDGATGQWVLVAGLEDPLAATLQGATAVGYIEPYPLRPRPHEHADVNYGLIGLVRSVDLQARRHRCAAGNLPLGRRAGELGALFAEPTDDCDPLWIDGDGRAFTGVQTAIDDRPSVRAAFRWTTAPLMWRNFSRPAPKLRASARRAYESARLIVSPPQANGQPSKPAGYLLRSPTSRTVPLHAAVHPVTGDQLLSTDPSEAARLGYVNTVLLGYLVARAPVTGTLGATRPGTPWAERFGIVGSST